jgi:hypothetical protein
LGINVDTFPLFASEISGAILRIDEQMGSPIIFGNLSTENTKSNFENQPVLEEDLYEQIHNFCLFDTHTNDSDTGFVCSLLSLKLYFQKSEFEHPPRIQSQKIFYTYPADQTTL